VRTISQITIHADDHRIDACGKVTAPAFQQSPAPDKFLPNWGTNDNLVVHPGTSLIQKQSISRHLQNKKTNIPLE